MIYRPKFIKIIWYNLFDKNYEGRSLRLIGVSLNNIINKNDYKKQVSLFENIVIDDKPQTTIDFINKINNENSYHLTTVSALLEHSKNKYRKE